MLSRVVDESSEIKDILNKINITLRMRVITLVSFLLVILIFWLLNLFSSSYINLAAIAIIFWVISAFIFKIIVKNVKTVSGVNNLYFLYSAVFELCLLTIVVFTAGGGIMWVGAIFYFFTIIYSNIVLPKVKGNLISLIAFFWFGGLACLQYFKIIPFLPYVAFSETLYLNFNYFFTTLSFILLSFILSGFSTSILTDLLRKRTADLEKLRLQLEEAKAVLEIKVNARTKELKEIADSLDEQVKNRAKELEEKMKDLKRFQSLSVGRELKMIELKEKIKKIENVKINLSV